MAARKRTVNMEKLREQLLGLREDRTKVKALEERNKKSQPEIIMVMENFDSNNDGIILDDDSAKGTAFVQQNAASENWDLQSILTHLRSRRTLYMSVTSRVFDPKKWEAEIANGNISPALAKKFKVIGNPPAPFIRFGVKKDESL